MRNRFDHLSKEIGKAALGGSGVTVVHDEIAPEIQHADLRHEPDPGRKRKRERLGLLGRMAASPCLIETYSHAPSAEELRACLAKHLAFWQQRARKARADNRARSKQRRRPRPAAIAPFLWIIAAGAPTTMMAELGVKRAPGWPAGVYFIGGGVLRVGLVVASQLRRERSTILVRLMAAGPLLARAIEELGALPPDAPERSVAEPVLLRLHHVLRNKPNRTPEEQEFVVTMHYSWEEARAEGRAEGEAKGRAEGKTKERADAVLTVLRARGITVPAAARKRILAQKDLGQLKRWLRKAIVATSIDQVLGDRS